MATQINYASSRADQPVALLNLFQFINGSGRKALLFSLDSVGIFHPWVSHRDLQSKFGIRSKFKNRAKEESLAMRENEERRRERIKGGRGI